MDECDGDGEGGVGETSLKLPWVTSVLLAAPSARHHGGKITACHLSFLERDREPRRC